jgi:hypothetical protein
MAMRWSGVIASTSGMRLMLATREAGTSAVNP